MNKTAWAGAQGLGLSASIGWGSSLGGIAFSGNQLDGLDFRWTTSAGGGGSIPIRDGNDPPGSTSGDRENGVRPWDLNGDGRFTIDESYNWWKNGKGVAVRVPLNTIDLSLVTPQYFNNVVKGEKTIQTQLTVGLMNGVVHGQMRLKYYGNNEVRAYYGNYDFEMHDWERSPVRNVFTLMGRWIHGEGEVYKIEIYGSAPISPNYNGIRKNRGY